MRKKIYLFILTSIQISIVIAQDLHFSNLHSMNMHVLPEYAGLNNDIEASVFYRDQWKSLGNNFGAYGISFSSTLQPNHKINGSHLAIGLNFYRELMNKDVSSTSAKISIVQHQKISNLSKLSFGLNMGFQSLTIDPTSGSWGSQHDGLVYNPNMTSGELFNRTSITKPDLGSGCIYSLRHAKSSTHLFQIGLSAHHLNRPVISYYDSRDAYLPIKYVGFTTFNLKLGSRGSFFQPSILVQQQKRFFSAVFGSVVKINLKEKAKTTSSFSPTNKLLVGIGAYYRTSDAFITCIMFQKTSWNLSLAYDFTVSSLKKYNYSRGGVELQFQFTIPKFQPDNRL